MKITQNIISVWLILVSFSCCESGFQKKTTQATSLFSKLSSEHTNIAFKNSVKQDDLFNCIRYTYALIGAGVAVGDIDNDGLEDIYFISNQNSNKLYLNKGDFKFEDITQNAQVEDDLGWSTGVSMVDINNDGWLDIYVCKSAALENEAQRRNLLFINQQNGSFKEDANSWGLDHNGFSIQSYFFDYDKDGDLDMYLVNHRSDFENTLRIEQKENQKFFPETSDHLFRNDGHMFTNVTVKSKIINKTWGLSASIGDFNNDNWPDIYVANDYIAPDLLYINNRDGTFSNQIHSRLQHISYNSMGSDYADVNNDLLPDLLVLEMSAEDHIRSKENMPTMNTDGFNKIVSAGLHKPYMANVLQLNNGNGSFSEIGQLAGISKTDWSWAPLIADFDNDGYKDIFITNGVERNFSNQDYVRKVKENMERGIEMTISEVIEMIPSEKLPNYSYRNRGDLTFENTTENWGLNQKVNSNGVAYADFDNDGDLDLVMNNLSDTASIYKNNSIGNYLNIKLEGNIKNKSAIGAKVTVYSDNKNQYQELYTSRGYLSSNSQILNFGFGDIQSIDRIEVVWPTGKASVLKDIPANQNLSIAYAEENKGLAKKNRAIRNLIPINPKRLGVTYQHHETQFNDFSKQVLLPQKLSQQGPSMAVADVNGDGLQDIFIGGAKNQIGVVYAQNEDGLFEKIDHALPELDAPFEDIDALFFDMDNDGDKDLYVASGSYEFDENDRHSKDRLYENLGNGKFIKTKAILEEHSNTKGIAASDFDQDGDLDLFIGGHVVPGKYPRSSKSQILENESGIFTNVTKRVAPDFSEIGIVNDIIFSDYDNDGDEDIFVVGEWMPISLFKNTGGQFKYLETDALEATSGWWNTIKKIDIDHDGDDDFVVGNLGKNNKFQPTYKKPLHIYGNNFDENSTYDMVLSKLYKGNLVPVRGKECSTVQNSFIREKMPSFKAFANASLSDIYGDEQLNKAYHKRVTEFSSVLILNNGKDSFEVKPLPIQAQMGPTLDFEIADVNKDGIEDIIGIGAIHETEVETIPYDGNTGYVLLGSESGKLEHYPDINFYNNKNAKQVERITVGNASYFFIANNNETLSIFKER